jgi:prepilin-type N-terminal cleavage/methylation domain-containing protein
MTSRGFSLIELLVALTISLVLSAGIVAVVPSARAAFELTPMEIDLQQRARTTIDVITNAVRATGADAVASVEFGPLSGVVPAVILSDVDAEGRFTRLKVIAHQGNGAQGVLDRHQGGPGGALTLAAALCPSASIVCGFVRDVSALISDGSGRFDVFTVAGADASTDRLTVRRPLSQAYPAGSFVVEVDVYTIQLDVQPDGSRALVRVTAGGAVQPLVDRVIGLWFEPYSMNDTGTLQKMPAEMLTDGPWLRGEPDGDYDEDAFRVKRVDVAVTLQPAAPATGDRTFRFAVFLRNAP